MTREEQQLHLNNIIKGIEEIEELIRPLDYQQFTEEEQVKEAVYMHLQMIGQAAHELESASDNIEGLNFDTGILSGFRNARYNAEAELDHQMVWNIISNDLAIIREEAVESSSALDRPTEDELHEDEVNNERSH